MQKWIIVLKILYVNCREMYGDMIDHHSNVHDLSSCLFILLVSLSSKSEPSESEVWLDCNKSAFLKFALHKVPLNSNHISYGWVNLTGVLCKAYHREAFLNNFIMIVYLGWDLS